MNYAILSLKKQQERRLQAGHLWIYSNEIDTNLTPLKNFSAGELVFVTNHHGGKIGIAYINPHTLLSARVLTRHNQEAINTDFFIKRIKHALQLRETLFEKPFYRLIFGESDGLPGLVVDRFNDTLVGQINTAGMEKLSPFINEALMSVLQPKHILWRNDGSYRTLEGLTQNVLTGHGAPPEFCVVEENNTLFHAPIFTGQKTGWFYDHRFNRQRIASYAKNKKVLDLFSYLGAFGIQLAKQGAAHVTCIDSSEKAVQLINKNAQLNHVEDKILAKQADAFKALEELKLQKEKFDVIVLDPPAFIKKKKDMAAGEQAYFRINQLAMELLNPNGILLSASCSMHLGRNELLNIIRKASIKSNKSAIVVEQLHQAADHPVHPAIEETDYLKGFILRVN